MQDLVAERIRRLHGDFLDEEDDDYEVVSSLLTKHQEHFDDVANKIEGEAHFFEQTVIPPPRPNQHGLLFYIQIIWALVAFAVLSWFSWRWTSKSNWTYLQVLQREEEKQQNQKQSSKNKDKDGQERLVTNMALNTQTTIQITKNTKGKHGKITTSTKLEQETLEVCSVRTAEAHHRVQNLSETFEREASTNTVISNDKSTKLATASNKLSFHAKSEGSPRLSTIFSHDEDDANDNDSHFSSSSQPPTLIDEFHQQEDSDQINPVTPTKEARSSLNSNAVSMPQSPPPLPEQTQLLERESSLQSTPFKFDSSLHSTSSFSQTPQGFAEEFCQTVQIMEQVLLTRQSSTSSMDSNATAVQLALLHQSSALKQKQQQKRQCQQQSRLYLEKYQQYLQELTKAHQQCQQSIWNAVYWSVTLCVGLEGSRYCNKVLESLEYFSAKQMSWVILQMACGCNHEEYNDMIDETSAYQQQYQSLSSSSYMGVMSHYVLSSVLEPTLFATTANKTLSSIQQFGEYLSCIVCYVAVGLILMMCHELLRQLHLPTLVHHVVNAAALVLYLAQNPAAWVVVTQNMQLYRQWTLLQGVMTIASFGLATMWHRSHRQFLLSHIQQQELAIHQESTKNIKNDDVNNPSVNPLALCEAGRRMAQWDDWNLLFLCLPPLLMGLVVLATMDR